MLAFEILTYAKVCCGFSVFASLKIPLAIQLQTKKAVATQLVGQPSLSCYTFAVSVLTIEIWCETGAI